MLKNTQTPNQTYAYFYLRGDGVEPNIVTRIFGHLSGQFVNVETNHWQISSADQVLAEKVDPHLEWILAQLEPKTFQLESLLAQENVIAEITIVFHLKTREWGHDISPSIIQRIGQLNLKLSFSFHNLGLTED